MDKKNAAKTTDKVSAQKNNLYSNHLPDEQFQELKAAIRQRSTGFINRDTYFSTADFMDLSPDTDVIQRILRELKREGTIGDYWLDCY